jgi:hypothetical protein
MAQGVPALIAQAEAIWPAGAPWWVPDSTVSAGSWTASNAATIHESLNAADSALAFALLDGAVCEVSLNPPALFGTVAAATLHIRARRVV